MDVHAQALLLLQAASGGEWDAVLEQLSSG